MSSASPTAGFPPSSVRNRAIRPTGSATTSWRSSTRCSSCGRCWPGDSLAGEELSSVATRHPDKIAGLVYLDAGYSYALYDQVHGDLNLDGLEAARDLERLQPGKAPPDVGPIVARLLQTLPLLEKELTERRKAVVALPAPAARAAAAPAPPPVPEAIQQIFAGERKFTVLPLPVLAIFAEPHDLGGALRNVRPAGPDRGAGPARTENQAAAFEAAGARPASSGCRTPPTLFSNRTRPTSCGRCRLSSAACPTPDFPLAGARSENPRGPDRGSPLAARLSKTRIERVAARAQHRFAIDHLNPRGG